MNRSRRTTRPPEKILYQGIALFGGPGTGKTTIGRLLAKQLNYPMLEASEEVIRPAATLGRLPKTPKQFTEAILKQKKIQTLTRDRAREFFISLKKHYGQAIIAQTLTALHQKKFANQPIIISGLRGFANAKFLKEQGYYVLFLTLPPAVAARRLKKRDNTTLAAARHDYFVENKLYKTDKIASVAHRIFRTHRESHSALIKTILADLLPRECKRCVNSTANPTIILNKNGLCQLCNLYKKYFNKKLLTKEFTFLKSFIGRNKKHDAMVGVSGGKDSTATLLTVKELGFNPLAFTFDTGYYPKHIFSRSKRVVAELGIDWVRIPLHKYIRPIDRVSFKLMAKLYEKKYSHSTAQHFRTLYAEGRKRYSVKYRRAFPFVRTCQLCRRLVIRAYYNEARRRNIPLVILGMNEWAGLSQNTASGNYCFSALRKLQPIKSKPPVYVLHLPFLLQRTAKDTRRILQKIGWRVPTGEVLIESNANSCLLARAAETKATELLGFHPDTTRLAREVTVGFISKKQAKRALCKKHYSYFSVRRVLKRADILQH